MTAPIIAPAKGMRSFKFEQSKYPFLDGVLPCRMLCIGASNSGKGIAVQSLILDVFRGQFKRIFYFSKTAFVDHTMTVAALGLSYSWPNAQLECRCAGSIVGRLHCRLRRLCCGGCRFVLSNVPPVAVPVVAQGYFR